MGGGGVGSGCCCCCPGLDEDKSGEAGRAEQRWRRRQTKSQTFDRRSDLPVFRPAVDQAALLPTWMRERQRNARLSASRFLWTPNDPPPTFNKLFQKSVNLLFVSQVRNRKVKTSESLILRSVRRNEPIRVSFGRGDGRITPEYPK